MTGTSPVKTRLMIGVNLSSEPWRAEAAGEDAARKMLGEPLFPPLS
jgi:hypothetical protein